MALRAVQGGTGRVRTGVRGGGGAVVPGTTLTALPTTPQSRFNAQFSTVTLSGSNVTSATDLQGLANATGGSTTGPVQMTDGLGRKFWRFSGTQFLNVASTFISDQRNTACFFVGRWHRSGAGVATIASHVSGSTTIGGVIQINTSSGIAPYISGCNTAASTAGAGSEYLLAGSQMQVIGCVARSTANGGQRLWVNNNAVNVAQPSANGLNLAGLDIGRLNWSANNYGTFDLYEIAFYTNGTGQSGAVLTNAQGDAIVAALVAGWGIQPITNSLIIEGDSIFQGVTAVTSGDSIGMQLTNPGASYAVPASWRVINSAITGNVVSSLVTRRDAASSTIQATKLSGRNVVVVQIGRNDWAAVSGSSNGNTVTGSAARGDDTYNQIVALLHTTTTGYLERGFEVKYALNITSSSAVELARDEQRTRIRAAGFLTDTLSGPGNTFSGQVTRVELPLWTSLATSNATIFDTTAQSSNATWMQGDQTHPTVAGTVEMAKAVSAAL